MEEMKPFNELTIKIAKLIDEERRTPYIWASGSFGYCGDDGLIKQVTRTQRRGTELTLWTVDLADPKEPSPINAGKLVPLVDPLECIEMIFETLPAIEDLLWKIPRVGKASVFLFMQRDGMDCCDADYTFQGRSIHVAIYKAVLWAVLTNKGDLERAEKIPYNEK